MPRILLVHQPTDGGVGRHVADLATGLARRGLEVTLCGPALPATAFELQDRVAHARLDLQREVSPAADFRALRDLAAVVREVEPDVLHAHSSKAGVIARLARLTGRRLPLVYTPHLYSFASSFAGGPQRVLYREIERALAPLASRVVCVCEQEASLARAIGPEDRVRVVYNGIPPVATGAPADARMAKLAQLGPVLCAIALLHPRKGLATLVDATPTILESHATAQIAIWGEGPDRQRLQARASELGVAHAVHFLGLCADPTAALGSAEVFVHAALAEAFPYVILEAMSAGVPIVASDVGGVGEAVIDGHSGVLVPPGHSASLAQAVVELLDDSQRRREMGANALARFEDRFTMERMLDGTVSVYGEIAPACREAAPARLPS
jgi:glycosyltransferase involved in cell wall biosynthesis